MPPHTEYAVEHVLHAIEIVHNASDENQRRQAEEFLENFEESNAAWEVCHVILDQYQDVRHRHFAARTLKAKIASSFDTLDAQFKTGIRDLILHHLGQTSHKEDRAVLIALCVAVVDLALQMPTWKDAANEMITRYGESTTFASILLEILTLFPEELDNEKLRLTSHRRSRLKEELKKTAPKVLTVLTTYATAAESKDPEFLSKIYTCLGSWCNVGVIPFPESMNTSLIQNMFSYLADLDTSVAIHDACSECLVSILPDVVYEATKASLNSVVELVESILKYEEKYLFTIQIEDLQRCKNYASIFVGLADAIVNSDELPIDIYSFPRLLEVLLNCCSHTDYEVVELVVDFWPKLCETKVSQVSMKNFKVYYARLLAALWKSCRYDTDGDWLVDKDDDFDSYRGHVWDCLGDIDEVIGYTEGWETLMHLLSVNSNIWDAVESCLFLMSAFKIPEDENKLVQPLINALTTMTGTSKLCFQHTVLSLYGHLGPWFSKHPEFLEPVLVQVVNSLVVKQLGDPASWALEELTKYSRSSLNKYFHHLLDVMTKLDCQDLKEEELESVSTGTINVLNEMPPETLLPSLTQLCCVARKPLETVVLASHGNAVGRESDPKWREATAQTWLNHLSMTFKHLKVENFKDKKHVASLIHELFPVFQQIAVIYVQSDDMMEKLMRCLRYMIRFLGKDSGASLLPIFAQFTDLFSTVQHSSIMYLASVLVDEFGDNPDTREGFSKMLDSLCGPTFAVLNSQSALRQRPDLIDDLFRLCRRMSEKMGDVMVYHPRLEDIWECSLPCCLSTNHSANHSVYCFWTAILANGSKSPEIFSRLDSFVQRFGPEMLSRALQGVFRDSGIFIVSDVAQLVRDLSLYDHHECLSKWIDKAISSLPASQQPENIRLAEGHVRTFRAAILSHGSLDSNVAAISTFINLFK